MTEVSEISIPLEEAWDKVKIKFRARFGPDIYGRAMVTARLSTKQTTSKTVYISVDGADAAALLGSSEYLPSVRQIWSNVTGSDAEFRFVMRSAAAGFAPATTKPKSALQKLTDAQTGDLARRLCRNNRHAMARACQAFIAGAYSIKVEVLMSRDSSRAITKLRHMALAIFSEVSGLGTHVVGQQFGGFNHGTVGYAQSRFSKMIPTDPDRVEYERLLETFRKAYLEIRG